MPSHPHRVVAAGADGTVFGLLVQICSEAVESSSRINQGLLMKGRISVRVCQTKMNLQMNAFELFSLNELDG